MLSYPPAAGKPQRENGKWNTAGNLRLAVKVWGCDHPASCTAGMVSCSRDYVKQTISQQGKMPVLNSQSGIKQLVYWWVNT
jgi:hypothetical protein